MATTPESERPEPPPELRAAVDRFRGEHPGWGTFDGAWAAADEAPHAMLAAAAAQGALPRAPGGGVDGGVETERLFGGDVEHRVARVGAWLVDVTARRFRPLDPEWPRAFEARLRRRHYGAEEFTSPWAPTPCARAEAVAWARDNRFELVADAPLLHVALRDRRLPGRPALAVVMLGLPRDGAPGDGRVAEVAPIWRPYDEAGARAAAAGVARVVRAARALGYASVVGHAPDDPLPDPGWPWGGDPGVEFEAGRGWVEEGRGALPSFLRPLGGRAGARVRRARRRWNKEAHEYALWVYDEAVERREAELGRPLTDEEASGVAYELGMYDHASQSWAPPRAVGRDDDEPLARHRLDFKRRGALAVVPLSRARAHAFVDDHHAHLWPPTGEVFALGVEEGGELRCALTFGRPSAQRLQGLGPWVGEVTRVACAPGGGRREGGHASNWASRALGAGREVADALGYTRVVSYTLLGEGGSSYQAAGYAPVATSRGGHWGRADRARRGAHQPGVKVRWETGPDAQIPGAEEASRVAEAVRDARGGPVPPRPPPPSDRFRAERGGGAWVAFDRVLGEPATAPMPRDAARREAAEREARRRGRR